MRVLVVNGYGLDEPADPADRVVDQLTAAGHDVDRLDLAEAGFDRFMTAAERAAYHTDEPLITPEAAAAADLVRAATGIVIAYPIIHHTGPPRVKSFIERVFVLGVSFEFLPSGRITGALHHMRRALVIGSPPHVGARHNVPTSQPPTHDVPGTGVRKGRLGRGRSSFGRCLARSFYLSSNRECRARYVSVDLAEGDAGGWSRVERELRRW